MPKRIQLKRTKGWRMPPGCIRVTRDASHEGNGRYGNPFRIGGYFKVGEKNGPWIWIQAYKKQPGYEHVTDAAKAVEMFERMLAIHPPSEERLAALRGHDLACFCALDAPCHADTWLRLANSVDSQSETK